MGLSGDLWFYIPAHLCACVCVCVCKCVWMRVYVCVCVHALLDPEKDGTVESLEKSCAF